MEGRRFFKFYNSKTCFATTILVSSEMCTKEVEIMVYREHLDYKYKYILVVYDLVFNIHVHATCQMPSNNSYI